MANLTGQVRNIAEVTIAVANSDLSKTIAVDVRGEILQLKEAIKAMVDQPRLTTDRNTEQDWLKANLAGFTSMLQGQRDLDAVGRMLLFRTRAAGRGGRRRDLSGGCGSPAESEALGRRHRRRITRVRNR